MIENFGSPGHAERMADPAMKQRQIRSLLDGNAERRASDRKRSNALEQHRQAIEGGITIQTIQIPTRAAIPLRVRGRCPFCAGSAFHLEVPEGIVDIPHVSYQGSYVCLLCTREVVRFEIGTRMNAEQFRALGEPLRGRGRPTKARVP